MEIRWRYDGDLHVDYRVDVLPRKSAPMAPDVPDAEPYAEPVSSPRGAYRAFGSASRGSSRRGLRDAGDRRCGGA